MVHFERTASRTARINKVQSDDENISASSLKEPGIEGEVGEAEVDAGMTPFEDSSRPTPPVGHAKKASEERLAVREHKAVIFSRTILFLVLITAASVVGALVYKQVQRNQQQDFEDQFRDYADRVIQSFATGVERKFGALDALSVTITSFALMTNSVFPNVTLPDFFFRGANSRILADTLHVWWCPLVTDETLAAWEAFASISQNLYADDILLQEEMNALEDAKYGFLHLNSSQYLAVFLGAPPSLFDNKNIARFNPHVDPNNTAPIYLPVWQMSPGIPMNLVNFNLLAHPAAHDGIAQMLQSQQVVIGLAYNLFEGDPYSSYVENTIFLTGQYRHEWDSYNGSAVSSVNYPVFDSLDVSNRTMVGTLNTNVYWRQYFSNILPETSDAVLVAVLKNTQNQTFSYKITGSDVVDLGTGDAHEPRFDSFEQKIDMIQYVKDRAGPATRAYTMVDLDSVYCTYSLLVYPDEAMKDQFITNKPTQYMLIVWAVFAFTSVVFIFYDCLIERRQRIVTSNAVKSSAIVSSLFPEKVRDRLYEDQHAGENLRRFLGRNTSKLDQPPIVGTVPIADLFENTTVLFADIPGFTVWSDTRTPHQVFIMLETVFQSFDNLATLHGVFKMETIGDCYMAVTGLPDPQDDHAAIMCKFGNDCIHTMATVTLGLADSLGTDTADLRLRVGLHSGPVTGGVLRGQKARFQLFGDTVNTASRMESTGLAGRIQVSQETADELCRLRKSQWVRPRDELVMIKGKGELQTYWVDL